MVVEGAGADAEDLGDRGDRVLGVGEHVTGGPDDLGGGDGRAAADPTAGTGGVQALADLGAVGGLGDQEVEGGGLERVAPTLDSVRKGCSEVLEQPWFLKDFF
ncbi:hypothetical protein RMN57_01820 [Kitasatospora sp. CM 4170]|uniref:Uncharacterized protein n=1 Tax=Kitasatospora aburaviensis TaxID=67265 RepID=A0ABW1F262_9ACTN|nr:hypothetical protein [Kitasatospora sp. CM 4170]WNM43525.1 hypothetical protein RMN57_01820 [Kitasatospora sp. CM 4170]